MKTYYKATRLDGTAFQDSVTMYTVGQTTTIARRAKHPKCCGAGVLHASDAKGEVLVGGTWPCRLFAVTGEPVCGFNTEHPHKGGFFALTVVKELPAWQALGPNGKLVIALINRIKKLTFEEAEIVGAAWDAAWGAAWDAARGAAWGAAWDAALAVTVKDKISKKHFDLLYGPLGKVIKLRDLVNTAKKL